MKKYFFSLCRCHLELKKFLQGLVSGLVPSLLAFILLIDFFPASFEFLILATVAIQNSDIDSDSYRYQRFPYIAYILFGTNQLNNFFYFGALVFI